MLSRTAQSVVLLAADHSLQLASNGHALAGNSDVQPRTGDDANPPSAGPLHLQDRPWPDRSPRIHCDSGLEGVRVERPRHGQ